MHKLIFEKATKSGMPEVLRPGNARFSKRVTPKFKCHNFLQIPPGLLGLKIKVYNDLISNQLTLFYKEAFIKKFQAVAEPTSYHVVPNRPLVHAGFFRPRWLTT